MENYSVKIVNDIGFYDQVSDSFYNLTPYSHISSIEKIILYLSEEKKKIIGIELFHLGYSTGVFQGVGYNVKHNNKIVIDVKHDHIETIHGCFVSNQIIELVFALKSGKVEGLLTKTDHNESKLTHFEFKQGELIGFKVAFNKSLTFLSPILAEGDKYMLNDATQIISTKTKLGKTFGDSINFSLTDDIIQGGELIKIQIFHDGNLLMGIQSTYRINHDDNNDQQLKEVMFGKKSANSEIIELNQRDKEYIQSLTIRSGDMIDNIMIKTSKGNCIISGGIGGGPHDFSTTEITNYYNNKTNVRFIGFIGSGNQVIHTLRLLFR